MKKLLFICIISISFGAIAVTTDAKRAAHFEMPPLRTLTTEEKRALETRNQASKETGRLNLAYKMLDLVSSAEKIDPAMATQLNQMAEKIVKQCA